jgi:hypothetical protein
MQPVVPSKREGTWIHVECDIQAPQARLIDPIAYRRYGRSQDVVVLASGCDRRRGTEEDAGSRALQLKRLECIIDRSSFCP